jgi:hypothetical protein
MQTAVKTSILPLFGLTGILLLTGCPRDKAPLVVQTEPETVPVVYERLTVMPDSALGEMVQGRGVVTEVISDRGFWIGDEDARIFVIVREDVPQTEMIDIDVGDRIDMRGIVMSSAEMDDLAGSLEQDARDAIDSEGRFIATHWKWTTILERGVDTRTAEAPIGLDIRDDLVLVRSRIQTREEADPHFLLLDFERWNDEKLGSDAGIDRGEFATGLAAHQYRLFAGFDADESGDLDEMEFRTGMLDLLSPDNGIARDLRFYQTFADWYVGFEAVEDATWDTDDDGELDAIELAAILAEPELFSAWDDDADRRIERDEFTNNLFDTWDRNDDGILRRPEFRTAASLWYAEFGGEAPFESWAGNPTDDGGVAVARSPQKVGAQRLYAVWDSDDDGRLTRPEALTGVRRAWDVDTDGAIEPWEWELAWLGDGLRGDFDDWDAVQDGRITKNEFDRATDLERPFFSEWDANADGLLSEAELAIAMFGPTAALPSPVDARGAQR